MILYITTLRYHIAYINLCHIFYIEIILCAGHIFYMCQSCIYEIFNRCVLQHHLYYAYLIMRMACVLVYV